MFTIYTSDMPSNSDSIIATFTNDTAILASKETALETYMVIQRKPEKIQEWLIK